ncbi:MAG: hypothetical protein ABII81_08325 [Pseudomonadota bacterium]
MATKQEHVQLLERSKTKPPKMYKVILLNDDYSARSASVMMLPDAPVWCTSPTIPTPSFKRND